MYDICPRRVASHFSSHWGNERLPHTLGGHVCTACSAKFVGCCVHALERGTTSGNDGACGLGVPLHESARVMVGRTYAAVHWPMDDRGAVNGKCVRTTMECSWSGGLVAWCAAWYREKVCCENKCFMWLTLLLFRCSADYTCCLCTGA